jgi:hypothetical protein
MKNLNEISVLELPFGFSHLGIQDKIMSNGLQVVSAPYPVDQCISAFKNALLELKGYEGKGQVELCFSHQNGSDETRVTCHIIRLTNTVIEAEVFKTVCGGGIDFTHIPKKIFLFFGAGSYLSKVITSPITVSRAEEE